MLHHPVQRTTLGSTDIISSIIPRLAQESKRSAEVQASSRGASDQEDSDYEWLPLQHSRYLHPSSRILILLHLRLFLPRYIPRALNIQVRVRPNHNVPRYSSFALLILELREDVAAVQPLSAVGIEALELREFKAETVSFNLRDRKGSGTASR